jgi:hypothetical protein
MAAEVDRAAHLPGGRDHLDQGAGLDRHPCRLVARASAMACATPGRAIGDPTASPATASGTTLAPPEMYAIAPSSSRRSRWDRAGTATAAPGWSVVASIGVSVSSPKLADQDRRRRPRPLSGALARRLMGAGAQRRQIDGRDLVAAEVGHERRPRRHGDRHRFAAHGDRGSGLPCAEVNRCHGVGTEVGHQGDAQVVPVKPGATATASGSSPTVSSAPPDGWRIDLAQHVVAPRDDQQVRVTPGERHCRGEAGGCGQAAHRDLGLDGVRGQVDRA